MVVYRPDGTSTTKLPASAYETPQSESTSKGAYLPATERAMAWMDTHTGLIKNYASVAAYFMPVSKTQEPFNDAAYQAQLELGLRVKKTPQEFMNDVYVKHAESAYYPALQQWDQRISRAKASGDNALASQLTQEKSTWEKEFQARNPLLGQKLSEWGPTRANALGQLADLRVMLKNGDAPDGTAGDLRKLITAFDNYEAFIRSHPGGTDANTQARSQALDMFNRWATETLTGTPLETLFNGVFRALNSNFTTIGG
jgi:hypothetical protein